jgi:hypothetical protein
MIGGGRGEVSTAWTLRSSGAVSSQPVMTLDSYLCLTLISDFPIVRLTTAIEAF